MDEVLELYQVQRLNWAGLGVVKAQDKVRCVPCTRPQEQVHIKWHDAGWGRFIGERIDDELTTQKLILNAGCSQALRCTGCSLRHLSPVEQRQAQEESHLGALTRLSGRNLDHLDVQWLKGAPRNAYRVRVTANLRRLVSSDSHTIDQNSTDFILSLRAHWRDPIDLSHCSNHPTDLRNLVTETAKWINQSQAQLRIYDDEPQSLFSLVRVSIQCGGGLPKWIVLHFEDLSHKGSLKRTERARRLQLGEALIKNIYVHPLAERHPDLTIYAEAKLQDQQKSSTHPIRIAGPIPQLWRCDRGLSFVARPPAWLPQSPSTLETLRQTVVRCLWGDGALSPPDSTVFELGCGVGVLGIAIAYQYLKVRWFGVDLEEEAALCAHESTILNQVSDRVKFTAQDGRRGLANIPYIISHLVVHAMRRPLSGLLPLAAHLKIKRVCYLAPSAPALGRDLAECPQYKLDRLFLIDQMPGTAQSMSIAQLSLNES